MRYTFRLMQESGVQGPSKTLDCEPSEVEQEARAWAAGQAGHPWDVLTVEPEVGDAFEVEL